MIQYINKFDTNWDKTKDGIVKHTIWRLLVHPDTKQDIDKLLITKDKISELTKTPMTIINKLKKDNVLLDSDIDNVYLVNQKKAYCKYCYYKQEKDNYVNKGHYEDPHKEFFVWEINEHLERFHHMNSADYNRITPEIINERILFKEPQFTFKEHKLRVKEIDTRPNTTYIIVFCEICKEEHTLRTDLEPCNNYNEVHN